jgi:hypothetical protein
VDVAMQVLDHVFHDLDQDVFRNLSQYFTCGKVCRKDPKDPWAVRPN